MTGKGTYTGREKKTTLLWVTKPYYMIVFGLHHNHKKKKEKENRHQKSSLSPEKEKTHSDLDCFEFP